MFIKLNKITLYVNFNEHKREYVVISIITIGTYFTFKTKDEELRKDLADGKKACDIICKKLKAQLDWY